MKECEKIREWMTAYLAGELSPEDAAVLRVHLETCPACREEWKELSAAWNLTNLCWIRLRMTELCRTETVRKSAVR